MAQTTGEATATQVFILNKEEFRQNDIVYFAHISDLTGLKTGIVDFDGGVAWLMADMDRYYLLKNCAFASKDLGEINRQIMSYYREQMQVFAKNVESKMIGKILEFEGKESEAFEFSRDIAGLYADKRKELREMEAKFQAAKKQAESEAEFERVHTEVTNLYGQLLVEEESLD